MRILDAYEFKTQEDQNTIFMEETETQCVTLQDIL